MPELPSATLTKIAALRAISDSWSEPLDLYQIIQIDWDAGTQYYSNTRPDLTTDNCPVSGINSVLLTEDEQPFLEISNEGSMGDQEIDVEIWDGDGAFADLVADEGEGQKCEIFLWFPSEELLLSVFWGHLRSDEGSDAYVWRGKIANGFRSPDLPLPGRPHFQECQAVFGALLPTQAEINQGGCPYNDHIGGGTGTPGFTSCPRQTTADCVTRGIDPLFHLSHAFQAVSVINNQTRGPNLLSQSRGNQSSLDKGVRVIMGQRRVYDMEIIVFRRDFNNNTPDRGWFHGMYEIGEGPIQAIRNPVVNDQNALREGGIHYQQRLGAGGQSAYEWLSTHGYSFTAWFGFNYGWIDPGTVGPGDFRGQATIDGLNNIRVYSDSSTSSNIYTNRRIWHIGEMLTNKRWGFGLDWSRINVDSFLECAAWGTGQVFTDDEGGVWFYDRGASNVELIERSTQQQIEDMCMAGRLSRPFLFQGELHIVPLEPLSAGELAAAPVFTDTGSSRNIIVENKAVKGVECEVSSLTRSQRSDDELPNRIEATFADASSEWIERPAPAVEDLTAQLKAGSILGDSTRRKVTKKYAYFGVTDKAHAVALSHHILWFGPFEEGGTKNNLEIRFRIWFMDAFELHEHKVVKVVSSQLTRYGFQYFRIKKLVWREDLEVEVTAQAYNETEIDAFETAGSGPQFPGGTATITAATNTSPVRITTSGDHGIQWGAIINIWGVNGMTELNGLRLQAIPVDTDKIDLYEYFRAPGEPPPGPGEVPLDGTGFGTYTSGGTITVLNIQPFPEPEQLAFGAVSYSDGVLTVGIS